VALTIATVFAKSKVEGEFEATYNSKKEVTWLQLKDPEDYKPVVVMAHRLGFNSAETKKEDEKSYTSDKQFWLEYS